MAAPGNENLESAYLSQLLVPVLLLALYLLNSAAQNRKGTFLHHLPLPRSIHSLLMQRPTLPPLPSPPSVPLLGHVFSISPSAPWKTFAQWSKQYGPVTLVRLLGSPLVVINTVEAAHELLDKKGANFSGRPRMAYFNEWLGWKNSLGFIQHNDSHRKQRRMVRPYMTLSAINTQCEMLLENAHILVQDFRESSDEFEKHILDFVSRIVVDFTYGYKFTSRSDPRRRMVDELGQFMVEVDWSILMVLDAFPFIEDLPHWLPFMRAKRTALRGSRLRQRMSESFFEYVQESRASGAQSQSIISQIMDDLENGSGEPTSEDTLETVMSIGTMMYLAGVETTNAAILNFLLAMVLHPHIARRAQEEIDEVLGSPSTATTDSSCRCPSLSDRSRMPYVECVLREVLRWNPPAPFGVAHRSEQVDEYCKMEVPGDCSIVANIWNMCHDEWHYKFPHKFDPDRFRSLINVRSERTQESNRCSTASLDPKNIIFGFGRRVCPGEYLADAILWTAMTSILANYDILPEIDGTTREPVVPEEKFTSGSLSRPRDFSCMLKSRH